MRPSWATAVRLTRNGMGPVVVLLAAVAVYGFLPGARARWIALPVALGAVATAWIFGRAVAQRAAAEHQLRRTEDRFRALLRDGGDVIVEYAPDGIVGYVSPAVLPVMGYRPDALVGRTVAHLLHPDDGPVLAKLTAAVLGDAAVEHTAEIRYRHADGTWHWHEIVVRNLLELPEVRAVVGHHRDVTERRIARERIASAATADGLTGLANAPTLARDLERALARGTRYQHSVGMLFVDLDGFRQVTEAYGEETRDRLRTTVGDVIRRTIREIDTMGRLGEDEFGVVLTRVAGAAEALAVAARIIRGIEHGSAVAGLKLDLGCSVGVAIAKPGGTDAKTLVRHAGAAMVRIKRRGRNGAQLYIEEEITAPWLI